MSSIACPQPAAGVAQPERSTWVDYAKAVGIVLVVYGHVARGLVNAGLPVDPLLRGLVDSIIYSFHMPLFFFLSALHFREALAKRGGVGLVLNKVDTIFYPYVLWSLLQGGIEVGLAPLTNSHVGWGEVLALLWAPRAQFWFLHSLFAVFVAGALLYSLCGFRHVWLLWLALAAYYCGKGMPWIEPMTGAVSVLIVHFALGIAFATVRSRFEQAGGWLAVALLGLAVIGQYTFHVTFALDYTAGGPAQLILATVSLLALVACCIALGRRNIGWLRFVGVSSMSIYLMHILAGSGIRIVLQRLFGIHDVGVHLLVGTSLGILLPLLAQTLIRRAGMGFLFAPPSWFAAAKSTRLASRRVAGRKNIIPEPR